MSQSYYSVTKESRAIARKPRDAVRFGLMFADMHYKFKSRQSPKAGLQSSTCRHIGEKKQNLTQKWPFKVVQCHVFWGQWKGGKGLNNTTIMLTLFSYGSEDAAAESPENRRSITHCRLTPHVQGNPANIRINIILPETIVIALRLFRWQYGSRPILIQIFVVGSENILFETEFEMAVQGHPSFFYNIYTKWQSDEVVSRVHLIQANMQAYGLTTDIMVLGADWCE